MDAWNEGYGAARWPNDGERRNPYVKGTLHWEEWEAGFDESRADQHYDRP
jgi:hypothetical protein